MNKNDFWAFSYPHAKIVESGTGIPAPLYMAYLSWESAYGTNRATKQLNNVNGIKINSSGSYNTRSDPNGVYASYKSIEDNARDTVRLLNLNMAGYPHILDVARSGGSDKEITEAHNKSGWSEADYNISTMINRANQAREFLGQAPSTYTPVENMTQNELIKYATIGLAAVAFFGLVRD